MDQVPLGVPAQVHEGLFVSLNQHTFQSTFSQHTFSLKFLDSNEQTENTRILLPQILFLLSVEPLPPW